MRGRRFWRGRRSSGFVGEPKVVVLSIGRRSSRIATEGGCEEQEPSRAWSRVGWVFIMAVRRSMIVSVEEAVGLLSKWKSESALLAGMLVSDGVWSAKTTPLRESAQYGQ
jgi:hypothetical protein